MRFLIIPFLLFLNSRFFEPSVTLKVEVTNVKNGSGKLWFAVFKPNEKFGEGKPSIYKIQDVKSANSQVVTFQLEPGRYAVAVYHDLNENGILDKNFIGIPKEPYGFSQNFRPRFSPPTFNDCAFSVSVEGGQISVKLTN